MVVEELSGHFRKRHMIQLLINLQAYQESVIPKPLYSSCHCNYIILIVPFLHD